MPEAWRLPPVINLICLLTAGLLLLTSPATLMDLLTLPEETPRYLGRMFGVLTLVFAITLILALRQNNSTLLARLGLIQLIAALLLAIDIVIDDAPVAFWVLAGGHALLGSGMLLTKRPG